MAPLASIVRSCGFETISYADDTQLIIPVEDNAEITKRKFKTGLLKIASWMKTNFLQLNSAKTEILLFGKAEEHWTPDWWPSELGDAPLPKKWAQNLGIRIDNNLSTEEHVKSLAGLCFGTLRMLRKIFTWIPLNARKTLTQALLVSRLDYANPLLVGVREDLLSKLQVVQNTAARLVLNKPARSPSVPLLRQLHWLPIRKRAIFRFLCMTFKSVQGLAPAYLNRKIERYNPTRQLRSSNRNLLSHRE